MQDITDLAFWKVLRAHGGGADVYFTEYFRVYPGSRPDRNILRSITENPTGCPVVAQMIGNDPEELARTARALERYPIAGIDLNLGCPAPIVYRKCAGGGLLRDLQRIDSILGVLRENVSTLFSVKTRVGFDSADGFHELLNIFARHHLDLLTVHGRTVKGMYHESVSYDFITAAVNAVTCPVLANGNIDTPSRAQAVLHQTGAHGLMIGRGAVRNPWLFAQIRQQLLGQPIRLPSGHQVLQYVHHLFDSLATERGTERGHVTRIKKHLNFLGLGVDRTGKFLHQMRRASTRKEFFHICDTFLNHDRPMALEPLVNLGS
jgi:tRNA-dihydrouridine synthase